MADIVDAKRRSIMMSQVPSKNTKPEIIVRKWLHRCGFRYGLHSKTLPGKPDIVLSKYRTVIFVHGCFWHHHTGCKYAYIPKTRTDWWLQKFKNNLERDALVIKKLNELGWQTIVIWECEVLTQQFHQSLDYLFNLKSSITDKPLTC